MGTVKDVETHTFINAYAKHLKRSGKIELPKWVEFVKTAPFKELAPYDEDWYFVRAAAIARKIYLRPGTGIGGLCKSFGGKKRRGTLKEKFQKSSPGIIRPSSRLWRIWKLLSSASTALAARSPG